MKNIVAFLLITFTLTSCVVISKNTSTQPESNNQRSIEAAGTTFNQKLADSLGADKYGMKSYFLVILKTGAKDKEITDKEQRAELFKGHFSNMQAMEKSGKLQLAGPFSTANPLGYRGIFLLDVKTEEEAKTFLQNDPTIKAGIFDVEILPWYGSAAIPMHLHYHKEIAKENP